MIADRSSMFTNSVLPFRPSEVRQFALNTSLSMNTSELEAFMDTSLTNQTLSQRTLVRQGEPLAFFFFNEKQIRCQGAMPEVNIIGEIRHQKRTQEGEFTKRKTYKDIKYSTNVQCHWLLHQSDLLPIAPGEVAVGLAVFMEFNCENTVYK